MLSSGDIMTERQLAKPRDGNKTLLVIASILLLAGVIHFSLADQRVVLAIDYLPTLLAAYFFGRKGGTLAALVSVILMAVLMAFNPTVFPAPTEFARWAYGAVWGAFLLLTGYGAGLWFDGKNAEARELRDTYYGILRILNQFVSKDEYTQNHACRVSLCASRIALAMGLPEDRVEDVRAAALLRDVGKLDIGREILYKAAQLSPDELERMKSATDRDPQRLSPVGGSLRRILPIVLEQPAKAEGPGEAAPQELSLESRILAVADVYDSLTSDRPYRKGMSPEDARDVILRGAGRDFDSDVVRAFERAFEKHKMEMPVAAG